MADTHKTTEPDNPGEALSDRPAGGNSQDASTQGEVVRLDLGTGASPLEQQVSGLEERLETLTGQRQETDRLLQELHAQTGKLQGNFDTHLDLTERKLQAVLEKYMGLKDQARKLGEHSARMETELASTRSQTEDLIKALDETTQKRIGEANEGVRKLLQEEAEHSRQRHRELAESLQATQERLADVEQRASRLDGELESRTKVLQGTIDAVERRLQQELQRIEQEARERDEALARETAELREADRRQEQRAQEHDARFGDLEAWVRTEEVRTDTLEERTGELDERTAGVEQRASELEQRSTALEERATHGEERGNRLEQRTGALEGRASALEDETAGLTRITGELGEQDRLLARRANTLEVTTEQHESRLTRLAAGLRKQLRGFSVALLLLLLVIGLVALYLYNTSREVDTLSQEQAGTSTKLDNSLHAQQAALEKDLAAHRDHIQDRLANERAELLQADDRLQEEVTANQRRLQEQQQAVRALEQRLLAVQDQADSAVGRLSVAHPLGNFGDDNIIHGRTWLDGLDGSQLLIRLAEVNDRRALYGIADQWSFYLRDRHLAYLPRERNGETLYSLYYGPFDSKASALQAAYGIPAPNPDVPLKVVPVSELQP